MAEVFLVCTALRPNFLADRPIFPLTEVHLARPNTKTTQNGPFIFGIPASVAPRLWGSSLGTRLALGLYDMLIRGYTDT